MLEVNDIRPSEEVVRTKQRLSIIGNAPALNNAVERAIRVAPFNLSVLITGESGSGKEFFPQIIHLFSPRKHSKYIAVNCGAIPEGTIDSELFGHEKGAFTGAVASRKGYFEEADGGTIFLDEVAELPMTTQARLLRVLETGEFIKVGSSTVQKTNIRVVAATNVDMQRAMAEGRFREDLFYRLSTVQITVPPLRERGNDIILLARKFATDFAERYRMPQISLTDDARTQLLHYGWPGNVRQLKNVVEQVALFEAGREINAELLGKYMPVVAAFTPTRSGSIHTYENEREALFNMIFSLRQEIHDLRAELDSRNRETNVHDVVARPASDSQVNRSLVRLSHPSIFTAVDNVEPEVINVTPEHQSLVDNEREAIRAALERNNGRRKAAAAELQISERTLYRKIKEYGFE